MSLSGFWKLLEIGAEVKTPLGLLGFVFAGLFLVVFRFLKPAGKQGNMTAATWRRLCTILASAAAVLLIALAIVSFAPTQPPAPPLSPPPNAAEERMRGYLVDFNTLDNIFEVKDPGWPERVREKGQTLVDKLGREDPEDLRPARKILQPVLRGWALSMIARSYVETTLTKQARSELQIASATQAIQEFDKAIQLMNDIAYRANHFRDDKDARAAYDWMMGRESGAYNSTHYLKAVCIALIARAGGNRTKQEVRDELQKIPQQYYLIDHPHNEDLNWALQD